MPPTQAPWTIDRSRHGVVSIVGPAQADGAANLIAIINGANRDADAALIEAAPDLRDALDGLRQAVYVGADQDRMAVAYARAEAALARAKGA